jgi:hypothetical protein
MKYGVDFWWQLLELARIPSLNGGNWWMLILTMVSNAKTLWWYPLHLFTYYIAFCVSVYAKLTIQIVRDRELSHKRGKSNLKIRWYSIGKQEVKSFSSIFPFELSCGLSTMSNGSDYWKSLIAWRSSVSLSMGSNMWSNIHTSICLTSTSQVDSKGKRHFIFSAF